MSNNKQSSIEWYDNNVMKLIAQYEAQLIDRVEFTYQMQVSFDYAKKIHEEEVITAWANGWVNGDINENRYEYMAQEYYNEIFKSK